MNCGKLPAVFHTFPLQREPTDCPSALKEDVHIIIDSIFRLWSGKSLLSTFSTVPTVTTTIYLIYIYLSYLFRAREESSVSPPRYDKGDSL